MQAVPMRSWLYVPADDARKIANAARTDADVVILDLEDGVAAANKDVGRQVMEESLASLDFGRSTVAVRINTVGGDRWQEDVDAACAGGARMIVVPKASSPNDLARLDEHLAQRNDPPAVAPIVTEDVPGFFAARDTIAAGRDVAAVLWGSEDLSASLGAWRVKNNEDQFLPVFQVVRSMTLLEAARHGKPAIDTVYLKFQDKPGLELEAREAAWMGFTGKQAIHPAQIPVINDAFTPAASDVEEARALVEAFDRDGAAVVRHNDSMADAPHLLRARRVLALAESIAAGGGA